MFVAGILLKGPIAPLLALTTCLGLVVMDRRAVWLKRLHILKGLLVTCCLVLPWAVAVTSATDGAFLNIAIQGDFLSKVQSAQESHGAPPGTYLACRGFYSGRALLLPALSPGWADASGVKMRPGSVWSGLWATGW